MEFPSEKALKQYLKDHPKANPKKHSVSPKRELKNINSIGKAILDSKTPIKKVKEKVKKWDDTTKKKVHDWMLESLTEDSVNDWLREPNKGNPDYDNQEYYSEGQQRKIIKQLKKNFKPKGRAKEVLDLLK